MNRSNGAEVEAVTFDFWDTLVVTRPEQNRVRRLDAWEESLAELDSPPGRAEIEEALGDGMAEYRRSWHANEQFGAADCVRISLARLGLAPADVDFEGLILATVDMGEDFELTPHAAPMLEVLRCAGLRLGIVCDVGFTGSDRLRGHLERNGVLGCFSQFSFSDEVGFYKPAPQIFEHALAGLGVEDPARSAHVGDLRRTDIAGARGHGMRSVRYTGVFDDQEGPEAHAVIGDHRELPAQLGIR